MNIAEYRQQYLAEIQRVKDLITIYSVYRTGVNNYKVSHFHAILKECENKIPSNKRLSKLQSCN